MSNSKIDPTPSHKYATLTAALMKDLAARIRDMQQEADKLRKELADAMKKRKRLAKIETQLQSAAALLRGDTLADKPKSRHGFVNGKRAKPIQHGSSVWLTAKVLYDAQQPMHIDKILERIKGERGLTFKKATVVSNLSRYVKHGDTFYRPAPNVYALIDFSDNVAPDFGDLGFYADDDDSHVDKLTAASLR